MERIADWTRRLWFLLNRRALERDLSREMAAHRASMDDPRRFGNTLRLREEAADVWGWRWLDELECDVRSGVRQMVRAPGVAAIAILTLTLGIGANAAIFSVVNALLLRPLPVHDPDRLAVLGDLERESRSWSNPVWEGLRDRSQLFESAFAWSAEPLNLNRGGPADPVNALWVSGGFFETLGVRPVAGRVITGTDDRRGGGQAGPVAVLSDRFWRRRFGAAPDVIGRTLLVESAPFTIIGVAAPGFSGLEVGRDFDVALPLGTEPLVHGRESSLDVPLRNWLQIGARLTTGRTLEASQLAVRAIQQDLRQATLPGVPPPLAGMHLSSPLVLTPVAAAQSDFRDRYARAVVVLLVVVALVLLVACVNVANLLVARGAARRHEMSVRLAVGGSRMRLSRMLLVEALLLGVIGATLGWALSFWLAPMLVRQLSTAGSPVFMDLAADWRLLAFIGVVALTTTAVFGIVPAWRSTRARPADALVEQRGRNVSVRSPLATPLLAAQLALALVLVAGAGLFIRTFVALATHDVGFAKDRVLVVSVAAPMTKYTLEQLVGVYERVRQAVAAVPGVGRASLSDITPLGGSSRQAPVQVPGAAAAPIADRLAWVNVVSPGWMATYDTRLLAGRDLADTDRAQTVPVALVNQAFARRFLGGANPVGRTIDTGVPGSVIRYEIVGLVEDAVYRSLRDPVPPTFYTSTAQRAAARPFANVSARTEAGSPAALSRGIAAAIAGVDPDLTLRVRSISEHVDAAMNQERVVALLSGAIGALALFLAGIGLYGVTGYAVSRRRQEIGVRMALGAARADIVYLIVGAMFRPVIVGLLVGSLACAWLMRFVDALVWGVPPRDPAAVAAAATVLAVVTFLAAWIPVRRASGLDPARALRD
jgi:predicted permease